MRGGPGQFMRGHHIKSDRSLARPTKHPALPPFALWGPCRTVLGMDVDTRRLVIHVHTTQIRFKFSLDAHDQVSTIVL